MVLLSLALAWAVERRIIVSSVLAVTGIVWKHKTIYVIYLFKQNYSEQTLRKFIVPLVSGRQGKHVKTISLNSVYLPQNAKNITKEWTLFSHSDRLTTICIIRELVN
jgi:hypothetical protein